METTYYTLTAREILVEGAAVQRASGDGARQLGGIGGEFHDPANSCWFPRASEE